MTIKFIQNLGAIKRKTPSSTRRIDFAEPQARRSPVLTVRIGVSAAASPYGRSRSFALNHEALDRLLATAAYLERRA
jgi:hypothetical protein